MSTSSRQIELLAPVAQDALRRAEDEGKSLEQWVNGLLSERFRLERSTEDWFKTRAAGSTGGGLRWALDHVPDRPPDPGDELED